VQGFNVHTLAIQVPKRDLTKDGSTPDRGRLGQSVIGVWATASRRKSKVWDSRSGKYTGHGPWKQVSRLGNPLFNEVIVPMAEKDLWNARPPSKDSRFAKYVDHPELAKLLPVLYPGVFPNLAAYGKARADLNAILLTGIPAGVVPGFQNFTGKVPSDMLRLNMAIPPSATENPLGLVAGDAAGFPNGRRLGDDVVTIELRAVAGLTLPLVDPSFTPGRRRQRRRGRDHQHERRDHGDLPLPRAPRRRLPDGARHHRGLMSSAHGHSHENPHAGQGSVLLDIGGDVGALVVTMPASMLGRGGRGRARAGHRRATTGRTWPSYRGRWATAPSRPWSSPSWSEGSYALVPKGTDDVHLLVDVRGGVVTSAAWPG
jgi:hypothetical protein